MLEMHVTGPGEARLLADGSPIGSARWEMRSLAWPGERVRVARVTALQVPQDYRADFWAYLAFLFQRGGAAAARLDGVWFWFSQALQKSWEEAGRPEEDAPLDGGQSI